MEDLFTLIVIVIVSIVSVIGRLKSKSSAKPKHKAQGVGGWLTKLNAYLQEMQQNAPARGKQADEGIGAAQWRGLMEQETAVIPPPPDPDEDLGDLAFVEIPEPPKVKAATDAARARAGLPPRKGPEAPAPEQMIPPAMQPVRATALPGSRADLRRAIVWSEILGPPVALKKPFSR